MSEPTLSREDLRAAVRAVLRDVLPADLAPGAAAPNGSVGGSVTVRTDAELDALVRRVAEACADPSRRSALAAGRHGFRLAPAAAPVPNRPGPPPETAAPGGVLRVDRGAVTERTVRKAAEDKSRIVVGRRAVLTPLARDRARTLGVAVEREA